jgi:hypothetical protein
MPENCRCCGSRLGGWVPEWKLRLGEAREPNLRKCYHKTVPGAVIGPRPFPTNKLFLINDLRGMPTAPRFSLPCVWLTKRSSANDDGLQLFSANCCKIAISLTDLVSRRTNGASW